MKNGIVKWFSAEKGYGFIACDNEDYFVHYREIKGEGYKSLNEGDKVEFLPEKGQKGWTARGVTRI